MSCEFCDTPGGPVLWQNGLCRVVRVDDPDYPGFCRVILKRHAREMTDLEPAERDGLMAVVYAVEQAIRAARARKIDVVDAKLCKGPKGLVYLLTLLAQDGKVTRATVDAASGLLTDGG